MNHGNRPHAEQQGEPKPSNGEEIDHQIDPERRFETHLGEHAKGWDEQRDDDAEDVAAGHAGSQAVLLVVATGPS